LISHPKNRDTPWTNGSDVTGPAAQRALIHVLILGRSLDFCGHHGDAYMPRLLEVADMLTDDRMTVYT
jgi:hypothetical protein